jgi:phosphatidylglycerol---prolipoprotein diacylglyceryl transferase
MTGFAGDVPVAVPAAIITIDIAPSFQLGPLTLTWHGLTIALGVLVGGLLAGRLARRRGLRSEPLQTIALLVVASALVGGRVYYLAETGRLLEPDQWLGTNGFTFYGGFIMAAITIAIYLRRSGHSVVYLDLAAVALPLGVAIGRIGDVINGEHYGPQTDFFLAVRNAHPDALTPNPAVAFHNGGLYEVILGLVIFALVWPLRDRLRRPTALTWLVVALFAAGRFVEFFTRADSEDIALGLNSAQWTSLALLAVALAGAWWTLVRHPQPAPSTDQAAAHHPEAARAAKPGAK